MNKSRTMLFVATIILFSVSFRSIFVNAMTVETDQSNSSVSSSTEVVETEASTNEKTSSSEENDSSQTDSRQSSTSTLDSTEESNDEVNDATLSDDNTNDDSEILAAIGKGTNFKAKLYLNYFGTKLDETFEESGGGDFVSLFFNLYRDQLDKAKSQFEIEELTIKQLMSTYILYDIAFAKNSHFMSLMANNDGTTPAEYTGFYPNTSILTGSALDHQTGKPMHLQAYYVNQKSNKTVVIHGGFRGNWDNGVVTPEYDIFYQAGYNLLFVDPRATGASDGEYVTYGQYESDDVLYWINQEISDRPQQGILLYGGSMGAATMMSTLAKPIPKNVKGIIENCGFQSIDKQLRYTYTNLVAPLLANFAFLIDLDMVPDQAHEDLYMKLLKENYFDQELHLNTTAELPAIGMSETSIPKLIIHGTNDNVVPVSNAQSLYALSKGYKDLVLVEGAGHGEAQKIDPKTYNTHVNNFLNVVFNDHVRVIYVDEQNHSLLSKSELVLSGFYGDDYKTERKSFNGYTLVSVAGKENGIFSEKIPTVTYKYKKDDITTNDSNTNGQNTDTSSTPSTDNQILPSNTTTDTTSSSTKVKQTKSTNNQDLKRYPNTGEKRSTTFVVVGILLIVFVLGSVYWQKRR